ncbi:MAG: prepilin peptidase [Desulfobacteraceae bacterium]|nr:MAG: prepilin peptidase [Desulfobacteraceae bacterium]
MSPTTSYLLFSFVFGLILGSFLNVCIHRIPLGKSIVYPPSSCPECNAAIRFYDNIPLVSYVLLLGKCRACRSSISIRYPVVELTTGLLSAALFVRYGLSLNYVLLLLFCSSLLVISFIDIDYKIIPDVISLPGMLLGFGVSFLPMTPVTVPESALGILLGGGSLYVVGLLYQWIRKQEGMGGGDVKLLAMIGAWLGWKSLPMVILLSSFSGALIGGGCLLLARRRLSEAIPFGPFLVLGTFLWLFFRVEIQLLWNSYLHLF